MKAIKIWTKQEDEILREVVAAQSSSTTQPINWHEIATKLAGRSNKDCRKRWAYCLAPNIKKGSWDSREIELLHEAVRTLDTKWASVAQHVQTRQPDQCARRWHEIEKPAINRGRWSLYEDFMLQNAVKAHGRKWTEIVERYFPDRTPIATKNRYDQLSKWDKKE